MYLAIMMFLSTSFYMMQAFVLVLAGATIAIACDRIDCNWGFCIEAVGESESGVEELV